MVTKLSSARRVLSLAAAVFAAAVLAASVAASPGARQYLTPQKVKVGVLGERVQIKKKAAHAVVKAAPAKAQPKQLLTVRQTTLPFTGTQLAVAVLIGFGLCAAGIALRWTGRRKAT